MGFNPLIIIVLVKSQTGDAVIGSGVVKAKRHVALGQEHRAESHVHAAYVEISAIRRVDALLVFHGSVDVQKSWIEQKSVAVETQVAQRKELAGLGVLVGNALRGMGEINSGKAVGTPAWNLIFRRLTRCLPCEYHNTERDQSEHPDCRSSLHKKIRRGDVALRGPGPPPFCL